MEPIKLNNEKMKVDGVFIAEGIAGSTDFAKKIGAKISNNKIFVNDKMETTVKGLFACGDCTGRNISNIKSCI